MPPIRRGPEILPLKITQPQPGVPLFIVDFGFNMAGTVTVRMQARVDATVRLRYGELLYADGTLNGMTSVAGQIKAAGVGGPCAPAVAFQTDAYTFRGDPHGEIFSPRFTWHGFRYVEVNMSEVGAPLTADMITATQLHTDVESAGSFDSSLPLLNDINSMFQRSLLANLMGTQSDCPHRERFGYGGDLLASAEAAMLNYDMAALYARRMDEFTMDARPNGGFTETAPSVGIADSGIGGGAGPVGWGSVQPQLAMYLYQYYGDLRTVEAAYAPALAYVQLLEQSLPAVRAGLSDWMGLEPSPVALTGLGFLYSDMRAVSAMAHLLGHDDVAALYASRAANLSAAINSEFLNRDTGVYAQSGAFNATQCAQSMPLHLGLLDSDPTLPVECCRCCWRT